jgi:hypothetical protein
MMFTLPGFGSKSAPTPRSPETVDKSGDADTTQPREDRVRRQNRQAAREGALLDREEAGLGSTITTKELADRDLKRRGARVVA